MSTYHLKRRPDLAPEVLDEVRRYCEEHPRSPAAVRHPRVMQRGSTYVALLGSTLEDGIAGLGGSVEAALHAFDLQYLNALRPPPGGRGSHHRRVRSDAVEHRNQDHDRVDPDQQRHPHS
jgi:hypothetical protein